MHSLWKGAISFGLVNIPVRLYTATEKKDLKFRYLHAACRTPIRYERVCPACNREVGQEEIVWGYEYEKDKFVVLDQADFESIPLETTRTIDILDFVSLEEIDPIFFEKSYYLEPGDGGQKAYALLKKAMRETGKIAVAKVVIRSKESLAVVRVHGKALVMETMFYPDEIRSTEALANLEAEPALHENEITMATMLISNLSASFEPDKYTNEHRETLMELINARIQGEKFETPPPREQGRVIDLMAALEASLRATGEKGKPPVKKEKRAVKSTGKRAVKSATGAGASMRAKSPEKVPAKPGRASKA